MNKVLDVFDRIAKCKISVDDKLYIEPQLNISVEDYDLVYETLTEKIIKKTILETHMKDNEEKINAIRDMVMGVIK